MNLFRHRKLILFIVVFLGFLHFLISVTIPEVCVWNRGFSFGLLENIPVIILQLINAIVIVGLLYIAFVKEKLLSIYGIGLVIIAIAGSVNLLDRILHGSVCDYIDLNTLLVFISPVPIFNINDVIIAIAIVGLIIYEIRITGDEGSEN